MKALISLAAVFVLLLASGCLGSSKSSTPPTLAFMYVVGTGDNSIHAINEQSTGVLATPPLSLFSTNPRPVSMALHPSKNFVYVANQNSNTVSGYTVDHASGALTPVGSALPPTPVCANASVCSNPLGLGISSDGAFLFVLDQGAVAPAPPVPSAISIFSIDATRGLLTPIAGSPFTFASLTAPNPQFLAVSPGGNVLYVSNGVSGTISAFTFGSSGVLTEVAGSPFTAGANITGLRIDPKGQFLYAADTANNKIASFSIAANGTLAPVAGSPFATDLGPVSLATDSAATFLFSANQAGATVRVFKIASGALTPVGTPMALVASGNPLPSFVVVDPSNTFLYIGNQGTRNISGFTIHPDGSLTPLGLSPFPQSIGPQWILMTQ
jgi:6-phosphogluconolactonase (cycloisomerase 2 family)